MNNKQLKSYLLWIAIAETVGLIAGILTADGTALYAQTAIKPPLTPPGWVFPVVWTVLYALMGFGSARISLEDGCPYRKQGLNLFVAQLIVNFFWPLLFFNAMAFGFALLWLILLWILVAVMILVFNRCDKLAALLQLPYFLWLSFALYLNWGVWRLNL